MVYLLVPPIFGVVALACYASAVSGLSAFAVGLLTAASALVVGGLLGFLFGIPRSLAVAGGRTEGLTSNTNLEQISDWLTKILVGLGLVELGAIVDQIGQLIDFLGPALAPPNDRFAVALGILTLFSVSGFLLFYLATRVHLAPVFAQTERQLTMAADVPSARSTLKEKPVDVEQYVERVRIQAGSGAQTGKDG